MAETLVQTLEGSLEETLERTWFLSRHWAQIQEELGEIQQGHRASKALVLCPRPVYTVCCMPPL